MEKWEESIRERELQERRRKAPGWLDREERILEPEKKGTKKDEPSLMDDEGGVDKMTAPSVGKREVDDLGEAMDRAFGRSEMG